MPNYKNVKKNAEGRFEYNRRMKAKIASGDVEFKVEFIELLFYFISMSDDALGRFL